MNTKQLFYPFGDRSQQSLAVATGDMAAGLAADSEILQFRNPNTTGKLVAIQELLVSGMRATTAFAVGKIDFRAYIVRGFTADGTGGATPTITGNNNKLRTVSGAPSQNDSIVAGKIRVATTAALGAGTKTIDSNPVGQIVTHSSAGVGAATPIIGSIYLPHNGLFKAIPNDGESPIILAQDEGIIVTATVPATGVWNIGFRIKWAEVDGF